ncbi:hypothetical protein MMC19_006024 [Ptychographa xylographoides]|nr:hypothetical protein [Ptychographa xylographoides]
MSTVVGLAILAISLIGSSFATTAWQLILTQGILYAIGGSLLYLPTIMYLDEWFVRRKGLALGVMFAGTGVGGMVIPLVMNWGLQKYGVATTLRFWAVTMVVLCGPLLYYIKPRIPVSPNHRASRNQEIDFKFLKQPVFWFMQAGSTLQGIGYFIPTVYLPTYAASVGLSTLSGSTTIALLNASSILGQIALGTLSDHFPVTNILAFSALGSSLSIFLLWGLFSSTALLYVFALVYGLSAGGFSSCWAGMIREVRKKDPTAETGLVLGLLAAGRGIGCVICGPLSNALLREKFWVDEGVRGAYGSGYGPLVIFTGVTAILGGVSYLGKTIRVF